MRLPRLFILLSQILVLVTEAAVPANDRTRIAEPYLQQIRASVTSSAPAEAIAKLAREAEAEVAAKAPAAMVNIYYSTVRQLQMGAARDPYATSCALEMMTRARPFLESIDLVERLWRLEDLPLPLSTSFSIPMKGQGSASEPILELDYLLRTWRLLNDELDRTSVVTNQLPLSRPELTGPIDFDFDDNVSPEHIADPVIREDFRRRLADYAADGEQRRYRAELQLRGSRFTTTVAGQITREYAGNPQLVFQLQETLDGYLPPETSTNVMNKVFAAMKPEIAAKTPRPVPGAKGERWIRAAAPPAGPIVPAVARPSKIRDAFNNRPNQGAVAAGNSGTGTVASELAVGGEGGAGSPVWPWAALGLVVMGGGWAWLRQRG